MSKNIKLNLVYGAALLIALVILIVVGFINNNALGYVVWMITAILGGVLTLWQKNRLDTSWVWILLLFTAGFGFPIAVLCLKAKEKDLSKEVRGPNPIEATTRVASTPVSQQTDHDYYNNLRAKRGKIDE